MSRHKTFWSALAVLLIGTHVLAEHAVLSEGGVNGLWHLSKDGADAVYVGEKRAADPALVFRKGPLKAGAAPLLIQSDARVVRLTSGERTLEFTVDADLLRAVILDGTEAQPTIRVNDVEQFRIRGAWIGILWREASDTVTMTFVEASYANVRFQSLGAGGQRPDARTGMEQPASPFSQPVIEGPAEPSAPAPGSPVPAATGAATPTVVPLTIRHGQTPGDHSEIIEPISAARLSIDAGVDMVSSLFYRGIARENESIILQPWADVDMRIWGGPDFKDHIFNSFHIHFGFRSTHISEHDTPIMLGQDEDWFEFAWRGGISIHALDRFIAGFEYENIESIRTSFRDVHQFNLFVKYDDSDPSFSWSLQPYVLFSFEYEKQSDGGYLSAAAAVDPRFGEGIYMEVGIRPGFDLLQIGTTTIRMEVPVAIGLSLSDYFEDRNADDSLFGFLDIGCELSIPLGVMATDDGRGFRWSLELGVHFLFLSDSLQDLSKGAGVGGDEVEIIGRIGIRVNY